MVTASRAPNFDERHVYSAVGAYSALHATGTRTATLCVTDVDCPSWPLCEGLPPLHPFQCSSYTVIATP